MNSMVVLNEGSFPLGPSVKSALSAVALGILVWCIGCSEADSRSSQIQSKEKAIEPRIYVADWANQRIVRMNDMQGGGWTVCDQPAGGEPKFRFPVGICVD